MKANRILHFIQAFNISVSLMQESELNISISYEQFTKIIDLYIDISALNQSKQYAKFICFLSSVNEKCDLQWFQMSYDYIN